MAAFQCIIRPHHSTACPHVDVAYCYRPRSVVCLSVCHCKNGCSNGHAVWVEDSGEPGLPCTRWWSRSPLGSSFEGETASHCKVYGCSTVKTAEPVEMSFGIWTRVDRWNHVLHGGSRSPHAKVQFLGERTCPDIPNHTLT